MSVFIILIDLKYGDVFHLFLALSAHVHNKAFFFLNELQNASKLITS